MSFTVQFSGDRLKRYSRGLQEMPKEIQDQIREATFFAQSVILKDFLTVADGTSSRPGIKGTRRTVTPGLRVGTGNLRRTIAANGVAFRQGPGGFEGAVGIPEVGGASIYGTIHERRGIYNFLKPGLERAWPQIQKMIDAGIQKAFKEI